jgi:hypothetical protein
MEQHLLDGIADERKRRRYKRIRFWTTLSVAVAQALRVLLFPHPYHLYPVLFLAWGPVAAMIYVNIRYREPKPFSDV